MTTPRYLCVDVKLAAMLIALLVCCAGAATAATISPVYSGSTFDTDADGDGDLDGTGYYSGGQPTVGAGEYGAYESYTARANCEFNISSLAGSTITSASLSASAWLWGPGGCSVAWYYYTGNGTRSATDYHQAATYIRTVADPGSPYTLNVDVTAALQTLVNGGATYAAFRGQRTSGTGSVGWYDPINLVVTTSSATYTISGTVTSGGTGLAGVTVTPTPSGTPDTTDASGDYTISGLSAGAYTVTPSLTGYTFTPTSHSVSVGPSATGQDFTATAVGGDTTVEIGTGTGTANYPMGTYYHDERTQVIYLASEIGQSGTINSLALDVATVPGQTMSNWTIRMKHTSMSAYGASPAWEGTGWTTCYQGNEPAGTTGWRTFTLTTPFEYNGTDNLLVDFSFNNSSYESNGQCRVTSVGSTRTIWDQTDSGYGDPLTWSGTSSPTPTTSTSVPNVRLTLGGGGSGGTAASVPFFDGFESGSLADYWTTYSSDAYGRIQVTSANTPYAGTYHVTLDRDPSGSYTLNELILTVDLAGQSSATLGFYHKEFGDESHAMSASFTGHDNSDGVAISADGTTWYKLTDLVGSSSWAEHEFDLVAAAASAGISFNSTFQIKFQQYDNYPITMDGFAFDNISITLTSPVPDAPVLNTEPTYTAGSTNSVSWGAVGGATGYYLEWDTSDTFASPDGNSGWITGTSHTATGLTDGQIYYYRAKARNAGGESGWSASQHSTQDATAPSSAVSTLPDETNQSSFTVSWSSSDATSGVDYVRLYYSYQGAAWTQFGGDYTGGSATFTCPAGDGVYGLYTRATDNVGNVEDAPTGMPDEIVDVDTTAPATSAGPLNASYSTATIDVPFTASDTGGTVASVDLRYRRQPFGGSWGAWTAYASYGPGDSPISFDSSTTGGDGSYEFYTIGTDDASNVEDAPASADCATVIVSSALLPPVVDAEPALTSGSSNTVSWTDPNDPDADEYQAQCAEDAGFGTMQEETGWQTPMGYDFTGLSLNQSYHYRARARKLLQAGASGSWSQTSQAEFNTDALTSTTATAGGDVELSGGAGGGTTTISPIYSGSTFDTNSDGIGDLDGTGYYSGGQPTVGYGEYGVYEGYAARASCEYDISSLSGAHIITARLTASSWLSYVGGTDVGWYYYAGNGVRSASDYHQAATHFITLYGLGVGDSLNLSVATELQALLDDSTTYAAFRGQRESTSGVKGWYDPIDLEVTYTMGYAASGTAVSTPIEPSPLLEWGTLSYNTTTPADTALTIDVLDASDDSVLLDDVSSGADLSGLSATGIKLRAELATTDDSVTPALHDWAVSWTETEGVYQTSDWSAAVSSTQVGDAPTVTDIDPSSGPNNAPVSVAITGTGFQAGASATLEKLGETPISGISVNVTPGTEITCDFDITSATIGLWDVIVTNPDTQSGTLPDGFEVLHGDVSSPDITQWTIAASHGTTVGELATDLPDGYCEARTCAVDCFVIHFDETLDAGTIDPSCVSIMGVTNGDQSGLVGSVVLEGDGSIARITLTGTLPEPDRYTVTISDTVCDPAGNGLGGDRDVAFVALHGDCNGNGNVDIGDMLAVRARFGTAVDETTCRYDVNGNGTIDIGDMLAVRARFGHSAPAAP